MYALIGEDVAELHLPSPDEEVLPGIQWGGFDELLTPAFWRGQAWQHQLAGSFAQTRLGVTLAEELAACLLGGHGMLAELGLAAFARLRDLNLLDPLAEADDLEQALSSPFQIFGKQRHYRFPRQKARYLSGCMKGLALIDHALDDLALREALLALPGIGPKTASWVVRNHRASSSVAIIDVHILRACRQIGVFAEDANPQRHYDHLEDRFLGFADAIDTPAALLDSVMWHYMRRLSDRAITRDAAQLELFAAAAPPHRAGDRVYA